MSLMLIIWFIRAQSNASLDQQAVERPMSEDSRRLAGKEV
jgi:hypothetical protein